MTQPKKAKRAKHPRKKRHPQGALVYLGFLLRTARERAGIKNPELGKQPFVANALEVSQALIAQYESGRVRDPDPKLLYRLAELYQADYFEFILALASEKYAPPQGWESDPLAGARWKLIRAGMKRFARVWQISGTAIEAQQVSAKARFVENVEMLDLSALAKWCKSLEPLDEVWLVLPHFVDDEDEEVRGSVVHNLQRNVKYVYFISQEHLALNGRFNKVKELLVAEAGEEKVSSLVNYIGLTNDEMAWLTSAYVIVNPRRRYGSLVLSAMFFEENLVLVMRLPDYTAGQTITKLNGWVAERQVRFDESLNMNKGKKHESNKS